MYPIDEICPCCLDELYTSCCGRIHSNIHLAKNALELMRSRYVAFVYQNGDFLEDSHHPLTRSNFSKRKTMQWAKSVQWLKLEIISFNELDLLNATVSFKAYFIENFKIDCIYEHSRFTKDLGYWTYMDYLSI
jgi:SEC-C motif domain protein